MMKNKLKKFIPLTLLPFLASCRNVINPKTGQVLEEFIIKKTTPFSFNMGIFDALLVWPLAQVINYLSSYVGAVGSIVILTLVINLFTARLNMESQQMNQKMQMLQPKLAALQEKYKGQSDQQAQMRQAQEMQRLYAKYDIKLSKVILPSFIQLPIMIAMWQGIQRSQAVIEGTLFGNPLYLSPLNGMKQGIPFYFILAILVIVIQLGAMFLPQWLARRNQKLYPGEKPAKSQNQGMMIFFSFLILYIGLTVASGMAIYLILSSLARIALQLKSQKLINQSGEKF